MDYWRRKRNPHLTITQERVHYHQNVAATSLDPGTTVGASHNGGYHPDTRGASASPRMMSERNKMRTAPPQVPKLAVHKAQSATSAETMAMKHEGLGTSKVQNEAPDAGFGEFYEVLFGVLMKEDMGPHRITDEEIFKLIQGCRIFNLHFHDHFLWSEFEEAICSPEFLRSQVLWYPSEDERRAALAQTISLLRSIEQAMAHDGYHCSLLPIFEEDLMRTMHSRSHERDGRTISVYDMVYGVRVASVCSINGSMDASSEASHQTSAASSPPAPPGNDFLVPLPPLSVPPLPASRPPPPDAAAGHVSFRAGGEGARRQLSTVAEREQGDVPLGGADSLSAGGMPGPGHGHWPGPPPLRVPSGGGSSASLEISPRSPPLLPRERTVASVMLDPPPGFVPPGSLSTAGRSGWAGRAPAMEVREHRGGVSPAQYIRAMSEPPPATGTDLDHANLNGAHGHWLGEPATGRANRPLRFVGPEYRF